MYESKWLRLDLYEIKSNLTTEPPTPQKNINITRYTLYVYSIQIYDEVIQCGVNAITLILSFTCPYA